MLGKDIRILPNPIVHDFLKKLFVLLVILYVIFFGAETILPGIVTDIFNVHISINNLLLLVIANLFLLGIFSPRQDKISIVQAEQVLSKQLVVLTVIFLSFVLLIALYRISLIEGLIYLVFVLIIGRLIFGLFKK